jgi:hypothetical protein
VAGHCSSLLIPADASVQETGAGEPPALIHAARW